jgi:hypothetical protein
MTTKTVAIVALPVRRGLSASWGSVCVLAVSLHGRKLAGCCRAARECCQLFRHHATRQKQSPSSMEATWTTNDVLPLLHLSGLTRSALAHAISSMQSVLQTGARLVAPWLEGLKPCFNNNNEVEKCVDASTDKLNCGVCGNVCPSGSRCQDGECLWDGPGEN